MLISVSRWGPFSVPITGERLQSELYVNWLVARRHYPMLKWLFDDTCVFFRDPRLGSVSVGSCVLRRHPLATRKRDRLTQERSSVTGLAPGQPRKQPGFQGDRTVGVEFESVVGPPVAGARFLEGETCLGEASFVENGCHNIPTHEKLDTGPIVWSGRVIIYRRLSWDRWRDAFFRLLETPSLLT